MSTKAIYFIAFFFVAVALGPALAHLLELPNKINLARDEYLTVQQNYRGWALLGNVVAGALLSTLALAVMVRKQRKAFLPDCKSNSPDPDIASAPQHCARSLPYRTPDLDACLP